MLFCNVSVNIVGIQMDGTPWVIILHSENEENVPIKLWKLNLNSRIDLRKGKFVEQVLLGIIVQAFPSPPLIALYYEPLTQ